MGFVPNPRTWSPGMVSSGWLNADVRDASEFLLKPPMAFARYSGSHDGGPIPWSNIVFDRDEAFSSSNRSDYVCKSAGYYHAVCRVRVENHNQADDGYIVQQWFETPSGHFGIHAHTTGLTTNSVWDYSFSGEFYLGLDEVCAVQHRTIFRSPILSADFIIRWTGK